MICKNCGKDKQEKARGLCSSCYNKEYGYKQIYWRYKSGAIRRGLEWNLTEKEFLKVCKHKCGYCGEYGTPYNGIDRIDNDSGYYIGNVVACCTFCNRAKSNWTEREFIRKCQLIAERYKK